jgi:putative salt-induced outer membrane protein YdiY
MVNHAPAVGTAARLLTRIGVVLASTLIVAATAVAGPKVDVVVLDNGDRLTCEIKQLERGRLTMSTDALDTVRVYSGRIRQIVSPRQFEVEAADGTLHFGALAAQPRGVRVEVSPGAGIDLGFDDVVRITPIEASVWQRMDGHVDLGFSFAKADLETRYTLNGDAAYTSKRYQADAILASQFTSREDAERLARTQLTLSGSRRVGRRWSGGTFLQLQTNEELEIDLRSVIGAGLTRYLAQSSRTHLTLFGGVAYTREQFTGEATQGRAEVVLGSDWDWFTTRNDHLDLSTQVFSFYGVTGGSRARLEIQSAVRFEFLKDFYFSVNGYSSFDSQPPEGRANSDVGTSLALGWSF